MHHLGRLLVAFYFQELWEEITKITGGRFEAENVASERVIGVSLDEIAQEAARRWRLPAKIANSMMHLAGAPGPSIPGSSEWLKLVAGFSGEAAAIVAEGNSGLDELVGRYGEGLLVPLEVITESVSAAVAHARETSLLDEAGQVEIRVSGKPGNAEERLVAGIESFKSALAEGMSFGNALNMTLETLYGSMGFHRVVAFLRDGGTLKGRVGFGQGMPEILSKLDFPETYVPDVFHLALANSADIFIQDVADPKISGKLPAWFSTSLSDVQSFILLPLSFNKHSIGALYGDWNPGTSNIVEKNELALMRALRDQLMGVLNPARK
jgi:hypothetical protein